MTTPTNAAPSRDARGPNAALPRRLLIARLVLAAAAVTACAVLVLAAVTPAPEPILSIDRVVRVIATVLVVAIGSLLLLIQLVAAHKMVTALRALDPTAALVRVGTLPSKTAGLAGLSAAAIITVSAIFSPGAAPAATVALLGIGLVSLILDTVAAVGAYRHLARSPSRATPSPATPSATYASAASSSAASVRRIHLELTQSVTLSRLFGTLLALSTVGIVIVGWIDGVRPATAALQVGAGVVAALVAFALAAALHRLARCITGDSVEITALPQAAKRLQLATGAAFLATAIACLAVLSTDFTVDQIPTYQALASVIVILLGVLNSMNLGQLEVSGLAPATRAHRH